jgi:hypothetical protein
MVYSAGFFSLAVAFELLDGWKEIVADDLIRPF